MKSSIAFALALILGSLKFILAPIYYLLTFLSYYRTNLFLLYLFYLCLNLYSDHPFGDTDYLRCVGLSRKFIKGLPARNITTFECKIEAAYRAHTYTVGVIHSTLLRHISTMTNFINNLTFKAIYLYIITMVEFFIDSYIGRRYVYEKLAVLLIFAILCQMIFKYRFKLFMTLLLGFGIYYIYTARHRILQRIMTPLLVRTMSTNCYSNERGGWLTRKLTPMTHRYGLCTYPIQVKEIFDWAYYLLKLYLLTRMITIFYCVFVFISEVIYFFYSHLTGLTVPNTMQMLSYCLFTKRLTLRQCILWYSLRHLCIFTDFDDYELGRTELLKKLPD